MHAIVRKGNGEYYKIPYRSLIPKGAYNMLVAERCISSARVLRFHIELCPLFVALALKMKYNIVGTFGEYFHLRAVYVT